MKKVEFYINSDVFVPLYELYGNGNRFVIVFFTLDYKDSNPFYFEILNIYKKK